MKIKDRKLDHIRICIEKDVESGRTGLEEVRLVHNALPETDLGKIDLRVEFLKKRLNYPVIIEAMTGGVEEATRINKDLASVAQEYGIGFGVGSQRAAIENPGLEETFKVRDVAPDILLIANLGAVQLNYGYGVKECRKAIDMIGADAIALHLNALQEAVQTEGNTDYSSLAGKINEVAAALDKPLIVKETGCGISRDVARGLKVSAIDVAGSGGTSWSLVESYRSEGVKGKLGREFSNWGIPTADALRDLSDFKTPLIASGGIRSGLDAAKSLALGADCVGMALPVLRAWSTGGRQGVKDFLDEFIEGLRVAMFLTGATRVADLRTKIRSNK